MNQQELLDFDRAHIWHPYAPMPADYTPYPVVSADGVYLDFMDGRRVIDGMASWWSAIHGYNHPRLNQAAHHQIDTLSHVMFGGLTHQPAVELSQRLINLTPESLDHVFLSDSGSVSVEVALKMAMQYWQAKQQPEKNRFLALRGGYHGDTFGAMSVCDPVNGMHHLFQQVLPQHLFIERPSISFHQPWQDNADETIKQMIAQHHTSLAAVIIEPIVQGAGGMWFYHPQYLKTLREQCNKYNILLIADEIATGFGRCGNMFACEYAGITPDLLCLGKALTGGYLSLAATITRKDIAETMSNSEAGCFMHGPTFMANPLACAIACASIDELLQSDWRTNVARIEVQLKSKLGTCREFSTVEDVRVLGAIGVIEMKQPLEVPTIQAKLVAQGVWCRPFGKLLYTMPAYSMDNNELDQLTRAMVTAVKP